MRRKRVHRFRNRYKKVILLTQIITVWYGAILTTTILTSTTDAYFNSQSEGVLKFQAGTWWDGSILEFTGIPTQNIKACSPIDIQVGVKNSGFDMVGPTTYEVFYSENGNGGNPKQTGKKVADGTLNPLAQDEVFSLIFNADKDGAYMFKLYQHPEFEEKGNLKKEIWSEKVIVNCQAAKQDTPNTTEQQSTEPNNTISNTESSSEKQETPTEESNNNQGEPIDKPPVEEAPPEQESGNGAEKTPPWKDDNGD